MRFPGSVSKGRVFAALDFGFSTVNVLFAGRSSDGSFRVIGSGESESRGIGPGEIVHLGDAVEAVFEAMEKAKASAGCETSFLYYNFDDPEASSVKVLGSKTLKGDGEVRRADIQAARKNAKRVIGRFERTILYAKETGFIIDDCDPVLNPMGVFGRKLDVEMHFIEARAAYFEDWKKIMERAGMPRAFAVPTALSSALAVLTREERAKKKLILDLGRDYVNLTVFAHGGIVDHRILTEASAEDVAAALKEMLLKHVDAEALITGERAEEEDFVAALFPDAQTRPSARAPYGMSLNRPRDASVAGLLYAADELERKRPMTQKKGSLLLTGVRQKAASLINEYF